VPHPGLDGNDIHAEREPQTRGRMPKIGNAPGQRSRHTTTPTSRPPSMPSGSAEWTGCQPATNATVSVIAVVAAGTAR
jgi:hypothetical protein